MATSIHKPATDDGWHGTISSSGPFLPDASRYHLYIGLFCPFAHRANLVRHLCGLQDSISLSIVRPYPKGDDKGWPGWKFPEKGIDEYEGATEDHLFGSKYLHEVYFRADKEYKGRYSVPLLWDKHSNTAVNNESAELLRWLPTAFPENSVDLYPAELRPQIDSLTTIFQRDLNSGVYKAGFAPSQEAYNKNVIPVFGALNLLEDILATSREKGPFVLGEKMTELDLRNYATIVRFDVVYHQHFKTNLGMIRHDYPLINNWLKNLYWNVKGFKESTDFTHIKENYTKSHHDINPKAITPLGPFPHVEEGYESDWSKIKPGGVKMAEVVEYEAKLKEELKHEGGDAVLQGFKL